MNIIIFGSNGMLGKYISRYLKNNGHRVIEYNRLDFDICTSYENETLVKKLRDIISPCTDCVVNCAGITNKRGDKISMNEMYVVNSLFPESLSLITSERKIGFIQPSTDCVFSGKNGPYFEKSVCDCVDHYGLSKSICEDIKYGSIIRCSILGSDENNRSLIGWLTSVEDDSVKGWRNHLWNGMTCLSYAKLVNSIIVNGSYWSGVKSWRSTYKKRVYITKYELLQSIKKIYKLDVTINNEIDPNGDKNMVLLCKNVIDTDLEDQLIEQYLYDLNTTFI